MALQTKIKYLSQSKSGREIAIKDDTGLVVFGRQTGYTESDISKILRYHFSVSRMFDSITWSFATDGTDPRLPTLKQMAYGQTIVLTTDLFTYQAERGPVTPEIFKDGIIDINMYVEFPGLQDVVIEKDTNYVYGGDLTEAWKADSIIVDGVIYQLDKSMDSNGNTVLYIIGSFEEDATSFNILYRANTKALLTSMSENLHDYACKALQQLETSPEWNKVMTALCFRRSAYGLFHSEVPDYFAANSLIESNFKLLKRYAI